VGGGGGKIFPCLAHRPQGHAAYYTIGTSSFPKVKRPRRGVDTHLLLMPDGEWVGDLHPPHLSAFISLSWDDRYAVDSANVLKVMAGMNSGWSCSFVLDWGGVTILTPHEEGLLKK
jgi:hypothetical protein